MRQDDRTTVRQGSWCGIMARVKRGRMEGQRARNVASCVPGGSNRLKILTGGTFTERPSRRLRQGEGLCGDLIPHRYNARLHMKCDGASRRSYESSRPRFLLETVSSDPPGASRWTLVRRLSFRLPVGALSG